LNRNQLNEIKKKKPRKNLRLFYEELCSKKYELKYIDFELCLYKDYGLFDIECSGLDNARKAPYKNSGARIYIWKGINPHKVWFQPHDYGVNEQEFNNLDRQYMTIICADYAEYRDALNAIEEAVEHHKKGYLTDTPFDFLFHQCGTHSHITVARKYCDSNTWTVVGGW
jgi:hypothetical protein